MEVKYQQVDGYRVPALTLEESGEVYGKYGMLRRTFLKEHRLGTYSNLILQGRLTAHLAEIDGTARAQVGQALEAMKADAGVTEELKARDPMEWTGRMNALKRQAEELVLQELVYS